MFYDSTIIVLDTVFVREHSQSPDSQPEDWEWQFTILK